jgi:hypothetical protein
MGMGRTMKFFLAGILSLKQIYKINNTLILNDKFQVFPGDLIIQLLKSPLYAPFFSLDKQEMLAREVALSA